MYHKAQGLVQVGMHKQAISLLQKIVKNDPVYSHEHGTKHSHEHDTEHLYIKDKILKDDYFTKLQDEKEFISFINRLP